jgi:hypothetical protein
LNPICTIDSVCDALDNGDNFVTVRGIREAEITASDQFTNKEYGSIETNHICSIIPSSFTEAMLLELGQIHMNNNYKGEEFENNNTNEMDGVDNKQSFQAQNSISFPLEHTNDEVTRLECTVEVDLNKAGSGIPVNNNDVGVELVDAGNLCRSSTVPCMTLESDGDNEKFDYSIMVKTGSSISSSIGECSSIEVEVTGSCGGLDDFGTHSTNEMNGSDTHFDSTNPAINLCSDLNIDCIEPCTDKDAEMLCGQTEHSDSHSRVTALPTWHSCIQNVIPEAEGRIHNERQTVGIYSVINDNSYLNLDGSVEQFLVTEHHQMVSCNFESHTNENKDVQVSEIPQLDQETGKSCVKTVTVLKQSTVDVKSPIVVDSLEHSDYGSTSNIKKVSLRGGKLYCNGNDIKLIKTTKHKKKEPGIT